MSSPRRTQASEGETQVAAGSQDASSFATILAKCKVTGVGAGKELVCPNTARVQPRLMKLLRKHGKRSFCDGFAEAFDQDGCERFLRPLRTTTEGDCVSMDIAAPSLVKVLLRVPLIQPEVVGTLTGKLMEVGALADAATSFDQCLPKLLISQLRWLEFVVNGEELCTKLLDCLDCITDCEALKRDLISALPEILDDEHHVAVVEKLQDVMESDRGMTVPVLDALTNLRIPATQSRCLTDTVLKVLDSADIEALPVVVRFLLQTAEVGADPEAFASQLKNMRHRLSAVIMQNGGEGAAADIRRRGAAEGLILEALRSGMLLRQEVAKAYFQSAKNASRRCIANTGTAQPAGAVAGVTSRTNRNSLGVIDVWLLIVLRGSASHRKEATVLLRRHVGLTGAIDIPLLSEAVLRHRTALETHFGALCELAALFIASADYERNAARIRVFGGSIYRILFEVFTDPCSRQEVVHSLVMHCGAGPSCTGEVDAALTCLKQLVRTEESALMLRPYAEFIKSVVDHVERMKTPQIRSLFHVMCRLALAGNEDERGQGPTHSIASQELSQHLASRTNDTNQLYDNLHILLRKCLTSPAWTQRVVGIIGGVQMLSAAALLDKKSKVSDAERNAIHKEDSDEEECAEDEEQQAESRALLELLLRSCRSSPPAMAWLFEELASITEDCDLTVSLLEEISDQSSTEFEANFVQDIDNGEEGAGAAASSAANSAESTMSSFKSVLLFGGAVPTSLWMNLDGCNASIAVDILPALAKGEREPKSRESLLYLCPVVRCMAASAQDEGEFDALLGAPLILPAKESAYSTELSDRPLLIREALCTAFFHAVNWVRQLLNAFANLHDDEVRYKLLQRLGNLVVLERVLKRCISVTPEFIPPTVSNVVGGGDCSAVGKASIATIAAAGKRAARHKKSASGKSKRATTSKQHKKRKAVAPAKSNRKRKRSKVGSPMQDEGDGDDDDDNIASGGDENDEEDDNNGSVTIGRTITGKALRVAWASVLSQLRPLSPRVCCMISYPEISAKDVAPGTSHTARTVEGSNRSINIRPSTMVVLLSSLESSLGRRLKAKSSSRFGTGRPTLQSRSALHLECPVLPEVSEAELLNLCTKEGVFSAVGNFAERYAMQFNDDDDYDSEDEDEEEEGAPVEHAGLSMSERRAIPEVLTLSAQCVGHVVGCERLRTTPTGTSLLLETLRSFGNNEENAEPEIDHEENDDSFLDAGGRSEAVVRACEATFARFEPLARSKATSSLKDLMIFVNMLNQLVELRAYALKKGGNDHENESDDGRRESIASQLSRLALGWIQTDWASYEGCSGAYRGYTKNTLGRLIEIHLKLSPAPLEAVTMLAEDTVSKAYPTIEDEKGEKKFTQVDNYPSLVKSSARFYYVLLAEQIVSLLRRMPFSKLQTDNKPTKAAISEALHNVRRATNAMDALIKLTKRPDVGKPMLRAAVKHGAAFISIFLHDVMPFFEAAFKNHQKSCLHTLKPVQQITRQLNALCAHGKKERDRVIINMVPKVKRDLELLIYRVKELADANNVLDRFNVGNLKNRAIDGTHVPDDTPSEDEDEENEEDVDIEDADEMTDDE